MYTGHFRDIHLSTQITAEIKDRERPRFLLSERMYELLLDDDFIHAVRKRSP